MLKFHSPRTPSKALSVLPRPSSDHLPVSYATCASKDAGGGDANMEEDAVFEYKETVTRVRGVVLRM